MKIKKSKMTVSTRHAAHSRQTAMKSIYEAIVELVANPGDSYNRLFLNNKDITEVEYNDAKNA